MLHTYIERLGTRGGRALAWLGNYARRGVAMISLAALCSGNIGSVAFAADEVETFYRGKRIIILVGFTAGGGFDLYARLLSRHMGNHIPGNPGMTVQNMPGSGSLTAALHILNVAPRDGTMIGTFVSRAPIIPILSDRKYDGTRFNFIGSVTDETNVCIVMADAPVKTAKELFEKTLVLGGAGPDSGTDTYSNLLRNVLNAKIRLVSGYPGTNDIKLAMLRGEVEGMCGLSYSIAQASYALELERKEMRVLMQVASRRSPQLPDIPFVGDLATPEQMKIVHLLLDTQLMARSFSAPPDVPQDRLQALRLAFDETMTDAKFLADARNLNLEVNPMRGVEMNELVRTLIQTPKSIVEKAIAATQSHR